MTFAFPKKQHLAQREAISALASHGKVLFRYPIKAFCLPTGKGSATIADGVGSSGEVPPEHAGAGYPRYVFTVPKKLFKRAVKRNLLKRRMREAVRLNQEAVLGDFCADFMLVYIGRDVCPYEVIVAAVRDILTKSTELLSENKETTGAKETHVEGKEVAEEPETHAKGREIKAEPGKPAKTERQS